MKLPQLTLRELFLLVVIAAMGCGWWVESARLRRQLREANEKLEEADKRMMRALISY
jgi:hypothetical protein